MPSQIEAPVESKTRSDRTTVALTANATKGLDILIRRASTETAKVLGYHVEPSRAQLVESLIKAACARPDTPSTPEAA
jgi:hypothetical protein